LPKSTVYGPVASWRLGRSIGIDLLCTDTKTCNFDCVYCQLGRTAAPANERHEYVPVSRLVDDLAAFRDAEADWVAFSGMGEPTLASNLGEAIDAVRHALPLPVAVITNASMIQYERVKQELSLADAVIAKLDAAEQALFKAINRPAEGITAGAILQGLQMFAFENPGKLFLDIMLTELNRKACHSLSYMVKTINPAGVYLNTPLRPGGGCPPLTKTEVENIYGNWFWNVKGVKSVYSVSSPEAVPLDEEETELRHPTKPKAVSPGQASVAE
jgi:wyosine [tRNA(Phe)-imidazoG37] synthetase (radical SAM superfamily)